MQFPCSLESRGLDGDNVKGHQDMCTVPTCLGEWWAGTTHSPTVYGFHCLKVFFSPPATDLQWGQDWTLAVSIPGRLWFGPFTTQKKVSHPDSSYCPILTRDCWAGLKFRWFSDLPSPQFYMQEGGFRSTPKWATGLTKTHEVFNQGIPKLICFYFLCIQTFRWPCAYAG